MKIKTIFRHFLIYFLYVNNILLVFYIMYDVKIVFLLQYNLLLM